MMEQRQKDKILAAMNADREVKGISAEKHAKMLGISKATYSAIANEGKASDATLISIARQLEVELTDKIEWNAVETATFKYVHALLKNAKEFSVSGILCDIPNIGKTFTAKYFVRLNRNSAYIDCSQVKSKQKLVRKIAQSFGLGSTGRYSDVYEDLVYYLNNQDKPLIVLDEAGDLNNDAFLELKALWNATERHCSWYLMGADGLAERIKRAIICKKVGFAEIFSRLGERFTRVTPDTEKERKAFLRRQVEQVAEANAEAGCDLSTIVNKSNGSLRRVYTELEKLKSID